MQRFERKLMNVLAFAGLASALAACTSDISLSDLNIAGKVANSVTNSAPLSFQGSARDFTVRPVTSEDLVGPQGQCAGGGSSTVDANGQPVGVQGGVALQMTECEVVQRAGAPDNIEFGGDRGERSVILTYKGGGRPGIYHFTAGRLASIERGAETPAPKPQKKSAPAKKRPPA
jgi:hypothetical protein